MKENIYIWIQISLKIVSGGPIDNKLALIQVMAWHQIGGKPECLNLWCPISMLNTCMYMQWVYP